MDSNAHRNIGVRRHASNDIAGHACFDTSFVLSGAAKQSSACRCKFSTLDPQFVQPGPISMEPAIGCISTISTPVPSSGPNRPYSASRRLSFNRFVPSHTLVRKGRPEKPSTSQWDLDLASGKVWSIHEVVLSRQVDRHGGSPSMSRLAPLR